MLEARGLTKYYSAITGVRDVNFRIEDGSVLGLLGPNGSGKSTTVGMPVDQMFQGFNLSEIHTAHAVAARHAAPVNPAESPR